MDYRQRLSQAKKLAAVGRRIETISGGTLEGSQRGTLIRKQEDGAWWAQMDDGRELCIGSGYDFRVISRTERSMSRQLEAIRDVIEAAENMLLHHRSQMSATDRRQREIVIERARVVLAEMNAALEGTRAQK